MFSSIIVCCVLVPVEYWCVINIRAIRSILNRFGLSTTEKNKNHRTKDASLFSTTTREDVVWRERFWWFLSDVFSFIPPNISSLLVEDFDACCRRATTTRTGVARIHREIFRSIRRGRRRNNDDDWWRRRGRWRGRRKRRRRRVSVVSIAGELGQAGAKSRGRVVGILLRRERNDQSSERWEKRFIRGRFRRRFGRVWLLGRFRKRTRTRRRRRRGTIRGRGGEKIVVGIHQSIRGDYERVRVRGIEGEQFVL